MKCKHCEIETDDLHSAIGYSRNYYGPPWNPGTVTRVEIKLCRACKIRELEGDLFLAERNVVKATSKLEELKEELKTLREDET